MKDTKKILISLIASLLIVLIVQVLWNNLVKEDKQVYLVKKDIYKGERITDDAVVKIKVKQSSNLKSSYNLDIKDKLASVNMQQGKLLTQEDLMDYSVRDNVEEEYEYITIELKNIADSLAYQLKKGDNINVYYTSKDKDINSKIGDKTYIDGLDSTSTVRIFENIKVIGLYNSSGTEIINDGQYSAIMLRVKKEDAILISNIKAYGTFNISYVK